MRSPHVAESVAVQSIKAVVYLGAGWLLFAPIATMVGVVAAGVAMLAAFALGTLGARARLRPLPALALGALVAGVGAGLSTLVRVNTTLATALGVEGTIWASDILLFGVGLLGVLFTVRYFAQRSRFVSVLEAGAIVFSVVYTFANHRDCRLNQPRELADRVLEAGMGDPSTILLGMGAAIMLLAVVMFMRRQSAAKTALSMVTAVAIALGTYLFIEDDHICGAIAGVPWTNPPPGGEGDEPQDPDEGDDGEGGGGSSDPDGDGEGGGSSDGDGEGGGGSSDPNGEGGGGRGDGQDGPQGGGGGGGGSGQSPFSQPPPDSPQPVAVVAFHDDYESREGILYFRQQVQSRFDQTHLTVDPAKRHDRDVIDAFPSNAPVVAAPSQNPDTHTRLPTSVFLLADHAQPISLAHAEELRPLDNPNPRLFVAAYDASSYILSVDVSRLLGRRSIPEDWDADTRRHYLELPDDPRYEALSSEILREIDLRFFDDDLMKAFLIKQWLEENGYYTLKETHTDATDPTASFLFGSLRGYCVHFAHAAAFLFRSQGIASRVAVGYAVDTRRRSGGSNLLILGNMAHAWPEIHLDGIGWVTFDIYPEQSDEPPQQLIDQDLESMLGEIARDDPSGGRADPDASPFPFATIALVLLFAVLAFLVALYLVKLFRRVAPRLGRDRDAHRLALRAALDALADLGLVRARGETREGFAARVVARTPSLAPLTMLHLRAALGPPDAPRPAAEARALHARVRAELRRAVPLHKRLAGAINPIGWWLVR